MLNLLKILKFEKRLEAQNRPEDQAMQEQYDMHDRIAHKLNFESRADRVDAPGDLRANIMAQIQQQRHANFHKRQRNNLPWMIGGLCAASLMIALTIGIGIKMNGEQTPANVVAAENPVPALMNIFQAKATAMAANSVKEAGQRDIVSSPLRREVANISKDTQKASSFFLACLPVSVEEGS